jgi:hypothetical protein
MFLSEWVNILLYLALQEKRLDDSSCHHIVEVARIA